MTLLNDDVRQVFDTIDTHIIVLQEHQIIFANTLVLAWLGLEFDDLPSHSVLQWIHSHSRATALDMFRHLLKGSDFGRVRLVVLHPQKGNIWVDATIKPATFTTHDHTWVITFTPSHNYFVNTIQNDTEIDLDLLATSDPLGQQALLSHVASQNKYVNTALEDFLSTLQDIIPYSSASIALFDDNVLRFVAGRGFPQDLQLHELKFTRALHKSARIVHKNATGIVQIIDDTYQHPQWIVADGTEDIRSWMGVELRYEDKPFGVLNIDSAVPQFFTEDHAKHALALSQQAMLALVYTRLYKQFYEDYEERKRLQQILVKNLITTETMYAAQELLFSADSFANCLPDLLHIIKSPMDKTQFVIVIFNIASGKLLHKYSNTFSDDEIWTIFQQAVQLPNLAVDTMPKQDIVLPEDGLVDLDDGRQILSAVVSRRGALIAVQEAHDSGFDENDHELIVTIANQITLALENETLYAQLMQHTQHLERLVERRTSQLSIERKRLKAILDSTAEGIFYMENFTIQYANPAFCRMVGYRLDDLYGKPLSFIRVTPEMSEQHNFNSLLDNPLEVEPGRSETRLRHQDGAEFYASIKFSLVGQPGEDPVRMVAIARDISQERKLYFQRARFIANAAHELRTPLSSLILRLHMLRRQPERMPVHLESLDKVTNYLKELVEELLTVSRFEQGTIMLDKDEYVLQELVQQATNEHMPFAEEQSVHLHLELPDEPITAKVDGKRIHQMLGNLVVNGINYSEPDDHVYIRMALEVDSVDNRNVIIHVIDEGAGIEPEYLPDDIFEPFARPSGGTRKETGMGLALVREIVTLHGGSVHARSKLGEGATFRVSLPLN